MSLSPEEKKSVLDCVPYFDEHSIVFDVGSNKGEFADLVVDNVDELHLFEPNEKLLTYTEVKYDRYTNVFYYSKAMYYTMDAELDFFYFTNENNGLSSIYDNPEWDHLPKQTRTVKTYTIDQYCIDQIINYIDFLKIDVEGAELDVLKGSEYMLSKKAIKYIQIEYSPHYKLGNHTFMEALNIFDKYGYAVYTLSGKEVTKDNFVEDYRLDNFIVKNMDITEDWNTEFKKNTKGMKFDFALEIGAFEGLTTTYICDNLLNEGGRIIAVDPLKDQYLTKHLTAEDKKMNKELTMFKGQYDRFLKNTRGRPVELIRRTSREAFIDLNERGYGFDFIYIDGDHREAEVYNDGIESFKILKEGGHILFDDYQWSEETKRGIDRFLYEHRMDAFVLIKDYQVLIKKRS